jgi:2Fe-2S ferredoxin
MPTIHFVRSDNSIESVEADIGNSAMRAALAHGLDGIVAECRGSAVCATCHVYVDETWLAKLKPVSADEDELLDGTASERLANSRLSCQIEMTSELDGLVLRLPARQT